MSARLLVVMVVGLAACGGKSSRGGPGGPPMYSTTPCSDACGRDANCLSRCKPIGGGGQDPLPVGLQPGK